jgi:phage terminase large subunit
MKVTNVFEENLYYYKEKKSRLIVNQGGTRSGKTFAILQLLFIIALNSPKPLIISVVSFSLPHLRIGAMREFDKILLDWGIDPVQVKHETNSYYKIGKSIIEFYGVDNFAKVHGPERDILFINECNYTKWSIYTQLAIRTKGTIFLDFNPTREFWLHQEVFGKKEHSLIKSTYLDNEFLTLAQIEEIESRKHNKAWWRVYGEGELGQLEDAILTNWIYGAFDYSLPWGFGMDFGSKHPDAMVRSAIDRNKMRIYWDEVLFESGLSTDQLKKKVKLINPNNKLIIADSAAPRTIQDLQGEKVNIKPVSKNKIVDDIKLLKDYTIVVTEKSYNLVRQLNSWVWLDKKGEIPMDEDDDLIDAGRYYAQTVIQPKSTFKGHKVANINKR